MNKIIIFLIVVLAVSCEIKEREKHFQEPEPTKLTALDSTLIVIAYAEKGYNVCALDTTVVTDTLPDGTPVHQVEAFGLIFKVVVDTVTEQAIDSIWQHKQWGVSIYDSQESEE